MGAKHFGARVTRFEDPALLAGRGRFVDDVPLPGALNACFVRSPHGHARIRSIDTAAARAMPGVHAVLTAADLPEPMRTERIPNLMANPAIRIMRTQHVLAREEVCYAGQAVARGRDRWRVASSRQAPGGIPPRGWVRLRFVRPRASPLRFPQYALPPCTSPSARFPRHAVCYGLEGLANRESGTR